MSSPEWTAPRPHSAAMSTPRVYRSQFAQRKAARRLSMSQSRASSPTPEAGADAPVVPSSEDELGLQPPSTPIPASSAPRRAQLPASGHADPFDGHEDLRDVGAPGREEARVWRDSYRDFRVPVPDDDDDDAPPPASKRRRPRSASQTRPAAPRTRSVSRGRRSTPARPRKATPSPEVPLLDTTPAPARKRARSSTARIDSRPATAAPLTRRGRSASRAAAPIILPGLPTKISPPRGAAKPAAPKRAASTARRTSAPEAPPRARTALPSTHPVAGGPKPSAAARSTFRPDFSADNHALPLVPLKRPRGRPRKNPLPPTAPSTTPTRGPGRPRIHPLPAPTPAPPKRRGRPPGSKNRRKSEGDAHPHPHPSATGGSVRALVDALEGRRAPTRTVMACVAVPRAPYALHPADDDALPVAPYDDDDDDAAQEAEGVVERDGWVALRADAGSDEEVEEALELRARVGADEKAKPMPKENARAGPQLKRSPWPARKSTLAADAAGTLSPTARVDAALPPPPGGSYSLRMPAAPDSTPAPAAPPPHARSTPLPSSPLARPPPPSSSPASPGVPVYATGDALYNALGARVGAWRAAGARFRFAGAWLLRVPPESVLDEPFVRRAAQEVVETVGMPFSLDRDTNTVVLSGQRAEIHLRCTCEAAWGRALACGGMLSLALNRRPPPPDDALDVLHVTLRVEH